MKHLRSLAFLFVILSVFPILPASFADEKEATAPPINRLVWQCPRQISWRLESTPLWYSMGHANRVLAIIPEGLVEREGQIVHTRDGSGAIHTVTFAVYDVLEFAQTGLPTKVTLLERRSVRADDKPTKRLDRWPFPSEQGYDWEMSALPPLQVQTLLRMFLHDAPYLWHTLMIHCESNVEPLPDTLIHDGGPHTFFSDFRTHILVMELLHDPDLSMTSTYIEPDDPPSTWWIAKVEVPAPWSLGKSELHHATGSLSDLKPNETPTFNTLTPAARDAMRNVAPISGESTPSFAPDTPGIQDVQGIEFDLLPNNER